MDAGTTGYADDEDIQPGKAALGPVLTHGKIQDICPWMSPADVPAGIEKQWFAKVLEFNDPSTLFQLTIGSSDPFSSAAIRESWR